MSEPKKSDQAPRAGISEFLRRKPVGVALLVAFTFLLGVVNQRTCLSLDQGSQESAAQHPLPYIVAHDPQNQPFYGLCAHAALDYLTWSPIVPVRVPAFVAGMLIPLVFYFAHRRWVGHEAAILVAILWAATDSMRFYMSVGRGYSLMVLGVLVLNSLLLGTLRRGGWVRAVVYVPVGVATCLTHLWAFPVLGAHGLFLVLEAVRRRGRGVVARRAIGMLAAVTAAVVCGIAVHLPMLGAIRAVAGQRQRELAFGPVLDALLQLPRFYGWTLAAHLLIVPIVLEGFARRPLRFRCNRLCRLYLTTIIVMLGWAAVMHSDYFGSRYLLGLAPAAAGLIAWGISGYWKGRTAGRSLPILAWPATWAIGLALGLISTNSSLPHEIWGFVVPTDRGIDVTYCYRDLARRMGNSLACGILILGVMGLVVRGRFGPGARFLGGRSDIRMAYVWTGLLLASLVPFVLTPFYSPALFELHTVAVAAVLLDAWEHRFDDRHLRALRLAFLVIALLAVAWQAGIVSLRFSPWVVVCVSLYLPALLIVLPLARTTVPACEAETGA